MSIAYIRVAELIQELGRADRNLGALKGLLAPNATLTIESMGLSVKGPDKVATALIDWLGDRRLWLLRRSATGSETAMAVVHSGDPLSPDGVFRINLEHSGLGAAIARVAVEIAAPDVSN